MSTEEIQVQHMKRDFIFKNSVHEFKKKMITLDTQIQ